jgi:hypothetical protein
MQALRRKRVMKPRAAWLPTVLSGLAVVCHDIAITEVRTSMQVNFEVRTSILAFFAFLRET